MVTTQQFLKNVRAKYPAYSEVPDEELLTKIFSAYPQYITQISREDIPAYAAKSADVIREQQKIERKEYENKVKKLVADTAITGGEVVGSAILPYWAPAIIGGGEALRSLTVDKEPVEKAALKGTIGAGSAYALGKLPSVIAAGAMRMTGVPQPALNVARTSPSIIGTPQKSVVDVGDDVTQALKSFSQNSKAAYVSQFDDIVKPGATVVVDASRRSIPPNINKELLADLLKREAKSNLLNLSDDAVDAFVGISKSNTISAQDAKMINSLLHDITETAATKGMGSGVTGQLAKLKGTLLSDMDDSLPGIRNLNKQYAQNLDFYEKTAKSIVMKDGSIRESALKSIGKEMIGTGKNKTQEARRLIRLQSEVPDVDFLSQLQKSVAKEAIDKALDPALAAKWGLGMGVGLPGAALIGGERDPGRLAQLGAIGVGLSAARNPSVVEYGLKAGALSSQLGRAAAPVGAALASELSRQF